MDIQERLTLFQKMLSCNYNLPIHAYDPEGNPLGDMSEGDRQNYYLFCFSSCRDQMVSHGRLPLSDTLPGLAPMILSDMMGLMWAAVYQVKEGAVSRIFLLGPAYIKEPSVSSMEKLIDKHHFSIPLKRQIMARLQSLPVVPSHTIFQFTTMLHCCINDEVISISDLAIAPASGSDSPEEEREGTPSHLGAWQAEQLLMRMIEEGNFNYASALSDAHQVSTGVKINIGDPLRQAKDSSITFTAIATRSAIRGGLSPATAYTLSDYYIQEAESCRTLTDIIHLNHTMYQDFITRVHKSRMNDALSVQVRSCMEYIDTHLTEKISLSDIASHVGYADYYLSRKFKKETGKSINEYISEQKLEYAKLLLATTGQGIQEISDSLNYCSRSYFSKLFTQSVGMSPAEYRSANMRL